MASGTVANLDDVLTLGFQGEVLVEGGDTVDLGHTDPQLLGDQFKRFSIQILVFALDVLHDGDQAAALSAVGVNDGSYTFHGYSVGHNLHLPFRFVPSVFAQKVHYAYNNIARKGKNPLAYP